MTGLTPATTYLFKMRACNGPNRCSDWTANHTFTTLAGTVTPGRVTNLRHSSSGDNSVTLAWNAPGNSAAAAVTSYHVQNRPLGSAWPGGFDVAQGAGTTTFSVSQLVDGTIYEFQVQACNAAGCGAWTELLHPDHVIVAGNKVGSASLIPASAELAVGERLRLAIHDIPVGKTAYSQMYGAIQPAGRCPDRRDARGETGPREPSPSTGPGYYDTVHIEGCAPGGIGWLRVVNAAETELYARATITVGATRPGQVARPDVLARSEALYVDWSAPSDGGSSITHYDLQYRAGTSGDWTLVEDITLTSYTITGLTNGTTYQVQVRAANSVGDGDWSAIVTGTPSATVIDPVTRPTTHDSLEPYDDCGEAATSTALAKPANLDIVPLSDRRAVLVWNGTTAADNYTIEVKETGTSSWRRPNLSDPSMNTVTKLCYTIHLDEITTDLDGSTRGLVEALAFDFQVTANKGTESLTSDSLTVIDTPIIAANGHSTGTTGQAVLGWSNVEDVLPLAQDAQHGKYLFRIRKFASGHANRNWTRDIDTSTPFGSFIPSDSNRNRVSSLDLGEIYAIQYRWNGLVSGEVMRVRAARDAYVWPSATPPVNRDLIATYPINDPQESGVLRYRVCSDSFPVDTWEQWDKLIPHAFGQWQAVGNQWGATANLVTVERELEPCTDYDDPDDDDYDSFIERVSADVTDALRPYLDAEGVPTTIPQSVQDSIQAHVKAIVSDGYGKRHEQDILVNEVVLFDDVQLNIDGLIAAGVFPQMAPYVGHFWCWGTAKDGSDFTYDPTLACVVRSRNKADEVISSDLFIRHSKVAIPGDLLIPGADVDVNKDDVSFNTCPARGNNAYAVLVHEAGHMLGIRGPLTGTDEEVAHKHPTIQGSSMMVGALEPLVGCSPHPFDVMVLYAIYQSR